MRPTVCGILITCNPKDMPAKENQKTTLALRRGIIQITCDFIRYRGFCCAGDSDEGKDASLPKIRGEFAGVDDGGIARDFTNSTCGK